MTNQFGNRISFLEPNGFGTCLSPRTPQTHPTIILGIQRDVTPPLLFGGGRLQRMRVIVVEPRHSADSIDVERDAPQEESLAELLPLLPPSWSRLGSTLPQPRPVLGEILRGEHGALYERFGNRIRSLCRLVSGPNGEVLEIADLDEPSPRLCARVPSPVETEDEIDKEKEADNSEDPSRSPPTTSLLSRERVGVKGESSHDRAKLSFRPLFHEPGYWRVVRLSDFKAMLLPQLAHPERLRDAHRLPCHVQIFEMIAPQRIEQLAEAIFGDAEATSQFCPLTPALVQRLQLAPLLPAPAHVPRPATRQAGLLLPHDRVLCLEVARDPTDETEAAPPKRGSDRIRRTSGSGGDGAQADKPAFGNPPSGMDQSLPTSDAGCSQPVASARVAGADPAAPPPSAQPLGSSAPALKTSIPIQFLKPWELRLSREEAMYDSIRARSFVGWLRDACRRLIRGLFFSDEFRKWQIWLTGKSLEEQIWATRPPKGSLRHPFMREWAQRTLDLAGYDSHVMLGEWEIYWRRKGL